MMERTLQVTVDQSTWPIPPNGPTFPGTFQDGTQNFTLNIPALLIMIGYLTTPSHSDGVCLSDFWAWVRYLRTFSDDADLQLNHAFFDLDMHQKTILSDDFGLGVPIYWLNHHLDLGPIADGRYFIDRVAASVSANVAWSAKRGPGRPILWLRTPLATGTSSNAREHRAAVLIVDANLAIWILCLRVRWHKNEPLFFRLHGLGSVLHAVWLLLFRAVPKRAAYESLIRLRKMVSSLKKIILCMRLTR